MSQDTLAANLSQLQSALAQSIPIGGVGSGISVLLLAMLFAAWKMPWAVTTSRFRIACWSFFLHLASGPILLFIKPAPSSNLPLSLPVITYAVAVLYFLLSLTNPPKRDA